MGDQYNQIKRRKLKEIRLEKNLTQEEVAREIEISLSQYQNIERGRSLPRINTAIRIANALGVQVDEIEDWKVDIHVFTE